MTLSGSALLGYLSTASEADVKALATIPGWQQTLRGMDPSKIGAWWAGMKTGAHTAVNESGFTQVQELLLAAAPAMFGALDGMPALARVRANQLNAPSLLRAAEKDLETARKLSGIGQAHHDPNRTKMLENEVAYLKQVEAGQVQLYLYDRDQSRIVEMIGTPGPDTRHVITYVPGTFTGMNIFYTGGVQQVSRYLNNNVPGTVAFVYKDGRFPGEADTAGGPNLARIGEANDEKLARTSGQQLAGFETGMRTDPYLNGAEQTGIGHSWGLANLTSSEVAGARYDKVISLAGAGMLPDWKPQPTTEYSNLTTMICSSMVREFPTSSRREGWCGMEITPFIGMSSNSTITAAPTTTNLGRLTPSKKGTSSWKTTTSSPQTARTTGGFWMKCLRC